MDQAESMYVAAAIDGEGCIALYASKRKSNKSQGGLTFIPTIQVVNTDIEWLTHIGNMTGAKYDIQAKPKVRGRANGFTLRFPPSSVKSILPLISPFLFIKKVHSEVLTMFFEHGPKREESGHGRLRTDEKFNFCQHLVEVMHRLNQRGAGAKEAKELAIKDFRVFRKDFLAL